jgi:hypothetical protein
VLIFGVLLGFLPSPLPSPNLVDLPAYYHVADLIDPHTRDWNNFLSSIFKKLMSLVCASHTDGIGFLLHLDNCPSDLPMKWPLILQLVGSLLYHMKGYWNCPFSNICAITDFSSF